MTWRWALGAGALCLLIGGCQSTQDKYGTAPKPIDQMTNEEWCAFTARYVSNPELAEDSRRIAIGKMKARGCPV